MNDFFGLDWALEGVAFFLPSSSMEWDCNHRAALEKERSLLRWSARNYQLLEYQLGGTESFVKFL